MQKSKTRKFDKQMTQQDQLGDILLKGTMNSAPIDEYAEKPRPNLFNVLKKLKENTGGSIVNRVCYIARVNETEFRGDIEKEVTNWTRTVCSAITPLEDDEDDFREGALTEEQMMSPQPYSGYHAIFGPWIVHLFEAENPLMNRYIQHLMAKRDEKGSMYAEVWVVHFQEDVIPAYESWIVKTIKEQTDPVIKDDADFDRIHRVYDAMVRVGRESHQVKAKGPEAVQKQIKSLTAELVPSGDQLNSVIKADAIWTLREWCDYQFITPEIMLERELQWPDEPELIY